jgi:hypothetical protein
MGKKRHLVAQRHEEEEEEDDFDEEEYAGDGDDDEDAAGAAAAATPSPASTVQGKFVNKQRTLLIASRGISHRDRHLLADLRDLLPHSKKDSKFDGKVWFLLISVYFCLFGHRLPCIGTLMKYNLTITQLQITHAHMEKYYE